MKQRYNITIEQLSILIILTIFSIIPIGLVLAAMSSDNYKIDADSINIGGSQSNSANYRMEDTLGEMGTSESASASYIMKAGYQAMTGGAADPTLSFSITDNTISLGTLSVSLASTDIAVFTVSTNASNGYSVTIIGNTLTHANQTDNIDAIAPSAVSYSIGSEQFGINLMDNSSPDVGASADGGSGQASSGYNTENLFKFVSGNTIASSSGSSEMTTFTISGLGSISSETAAGDYSTDLCLIATGSF
jgi:hypothetical protein